MSGPGRRIAVMHGVNLDQLGRRDPALYGSLTLADLEAQIERDARELGLEPGFFHTNHEGAFVEHLHSVLGHRRWGSAQPAVHGRTTRGRSTMPFEIAGLPALEMHLSDVARREPWRRVSVIGELCFARSPPAVSMDTARRWSGCARSSIGAPMTGDADSLARPPARARPLAETTEPGSMR